MSYSCNYIEAICRFRVSAAYLNSAWHVPKMFADAYLAVIRDGNRDADHLAVVISAVAYSFFLWCRLSNGLSAWRAWKSVLRQVKRVMKSAPLYLCTLPCSQNRIIFRSIYSKVNRKKERRYCLSLIYIYIYIAIFNLDTTAEHYTRKSK